MMSPYIFVVAVILAIIPMLILFKLSMERIKDDPEQIAKVQTHFLIGAALSEAIPIILIVYGFANLTPVNNVQELYMPGIIILLIVSASLFFIMLQRAVNIEEDVKGIINQFVIISLGITNAIPMVSIIALFLMIPN